MSKILIVDDSATVRMQVGMALRQAGFTVIEAEDGEQGYEQAMAGGVALVVSDVNMPKMDGIEMLEKLTASGFDRPVIMLTTEGQPELVKRAKAAGAKGWMVKPFKAPMLVQVAQKLAA